MKKIISLISAIIFAAAAVINVSAADSAYSTRKDFIWGVNGHRYNQAGYQREYLEDQIKTAAELGVKLYRIDLSASLGFDYIDEVVSLCNAYGMKVMAVLTQLGSKLELVQVQANAFAQRYNGKRGYGKIDYFQIENETEIGMLQKKWGNSAPMGKEISDYFTEDLEYYYEIFSYAAKGIRAADTDAKICINMSYYHYGPFKYYCEKGLDFDMIGLDWYENMGDISMVLDELVANFDKEIFICETNVWDDEMAYDNSSFEDWRTVLDYMKIAYEYPQVKGLAFYELLDQVAIEGVEGIFGLVECDSTGKIGTPKAIYNEIQRILGGKEMKRITLEEIRAKFPVEEPEISSESSVSSQVTQQENHESSQQESSSSQTVESQETVVIQPEDNIQNVTVTRTSYHFPLALFIGISAVLVLISGGVIGFYFWRIKKSGKLKK